MSYKIAFLPQARKDFDEWKKTDEKTTIRIKNILRDISEHPFSGIAKPEPLKNNLSGKWSRRINKTDRIVYSVDGDIVTVFVFSATPFPVTINKSGSEKRSAKAQLALQKLQNASAQDGKKWTDKEINNLISEYRRKKK